MPTRIFCHCRFADAGWRPMVALAGRSCPSPTMPGCLSLIPHGQFCTGRAGSSPTYGGSMYFYRYPNGGRTKARPYSIFCQCRFADVAWRPMVALAGRTGPSPTMPGCLSLIPHGQSCTGRTGPSPYVCW